MPALTTSRRNISHEATIVCVAYCSLPFSMDQNDIARRQRAATCCFPAAIPANGRKVFLRKNAEGVGHLPLVL